MSSKPRIVFDEGPVHILATLSVPGAKRRKILDGLRDSIQVDPKLRDLHEPVRPEPTTQAQQ